MIYIKDSTNKNNIKSDNAANIFLQKDKPQKQKRKKKIKKNN